jgi:hypothetical protein
MGSSASSGMRSQGGSATFGLKKPAPLWTAPAFDRCLLLALNPGISGWKRGLSAATIGLLSLVVWYWARGKMEFLPWADSAIDALGRVYGVVAAGGVARRVAVRVARAVAFVVAIGVLIVVVINVVSGVVLAGFAASDVAGAGAFALVVAVVVAAVVAGLTSWPSNTDCKVFFCRFFRLR